MGGWSGTEPAKCSRRSEPPCVLEAGGAGGGAVIGLAFSVAPFVRFDACSARCRLGFAPFARALDAPVMRGEIDMSASFAADKKNVPHLRIVSPVAPVFRNCSSNCPCVALARLKPSALNRNGYED